MTDSVLTQLAALQTMSTPQLRERWRELFGKEAPNFNRRYILSRLSYRLQELIHGGLRPETIKRLEALAKQFDETDPVRRRVKEHLRPIAGTKLIREWQGVEHVVTVHPDNFEWEGRPYKSLSAVARAISGTQWNGWTFFGLRRSGSAS